MIYTETNANRCSFVLTLIGVLVLTSETLLLRLINIDPWTMNFWRGLMMAIGLVVAYSLIQRGKIRNEIAQIGIAGIALAIVFALNSITFVFAVNHTKVANVLIILASTPLMAALLSVIILKENVPKSTWAAIIAGMTGVIFVTGDGLRSGVWLGEIFAFISALTLAVTFIIINRNKHLSMIPAAVFGAAISAIIVAPFASPMSIISTNWELLFLLGFIVLPLSFGLITHGLRTVPAPEVALLMLLETVLGPLWVWIAINEMPTKNTFIGGIVIISAVALQSAWRFRPSRSNISLD
ncbi:MAG: hypothetical protein CMF69_06015 [Magnetovibrio sp.]|nr:hypothetical protein [Magnetovibrio sp.]